MALANPRIAFDESRSFASRFRRLARSDLVAVPHAGSMDARCATLCRTCLLLGEGGEYFSQGVRPQCSAYFPSSTRTMSITWMAICLPVAGIPNSVPE